MRCRVECVLDKCAEDVFDALADHESYERYPGFTSSILLEPGTVEKNGVGALRRLAGAGASFEERITVFERPLKMSYHCEKVRPIPLRHERGDILLEPMGDQTRVIWISEGRIRIPVVGHFFEKFMERRASQAFLMILKHIEKSCGSS